MRDADQHDPRSDRGGGDGGAAPRREPADGVPRDPTSEPDVEPRSAPDVGAGAVARSGAEAEFPVAPRRRGPAGRRPMVSVPAAEGAHATWVQTPADFEDELALEAPSERPRRDALATLTSAWLVTTALAAIVGTAYFGEALEGASIGVRAFAVAALVSSLATVLLVAWLPLVVPTLVWPRARTLGVFVSAYGALALVAVYADTRIYGLFRYHMNGMVWNLITTPGGTDNFQITIGTWLTVAFGALVAFSILWATWEAVEHRRPRRWLRRALLALFVVVIAEKVTFAVADATRNRAVTARAALFPLYQRFTMKKTLARFLDVDTTPDTRVHVAGEGLLLRYPLAQPSLPASAPRHNVLIVVIDSLRADAFTPELMPRVSEWSRGARVFTDHLSGGNATRFGIFSLVYGLHGTYWMPVYAERTPPVLVTALDAAGFDLRVISAAKMSYPEFRSTAWVTMEDRVEDAFEEPEKYQRDVSVAARFEDFLDARAAREASEPFFVFTLLDSPHQTYSWPPEDTHYEPSTRTLDYLELARRPDDDDLERVRNAYKNSVRHADRVTGRMLDALRAKGILEDTLVVVTGDHGEEFWEHGYFGHTSNFTPEQVHVAFVLGGPGVPSGTETRPTCHVDVAPTLLEHLGADPALRASWCQGVNLLSPPERRERVIGGWQEVAVWVDGGVLHVPLEGHRGLVEARDFAWKPISNERAFLDRHGRAIAELALECRRFQK